ncbi:type II toxin-antitoxin system VapC family toxin [Muricauda sp. 334s03]|uniref:Type II toxin-antitoxin system VapC family toxin n=1 Tax=Flagellimonas yonaguniensis TaxID=3031325 RepID=A0ABT5Y0L9_9FLAO|nr:type II toxin-antitoxin system VapC family toxin [[Muricauda] yonaguniensis]MDF0716993.1 type II toxin-antitoxin system VapC family toxin [[Muricauda] yonaguniensis]
MKLIFDSNVFDDLITEKLDLRIVKNKSHEVYITHIQVDEINECYDKEKRARLFNSMTEVRPEKITTESFIIGTSRIGSAKIGNGNLFEQLRMGNYKKTNDALIGETAIKNNLTLITNDKKFKNKVIELGGNALTVEELINE